MYIMRDVCARLIVHVGTAAATARTWSNLLLFSVFFSFRFFSDRLFGYVNARPARVIICSNDFFHPKIANPFFYNDDNHDDDDKESFNGGQGYFFMVLLIFFCFFGVFYFYYNYFFLLRSVGDAFMVQHLKKKLPKKIFTLVSVKSRDIFFFLDSGGSSVRAYII